MDLATGVVNVVNNMDEQARFPQFMQQALLNRSLMISDKALVRALQQATCPSAKPQDNQSPFQSNEYILSAEVGTKIHSRAAQEIASRYKVLEVESSLNVSLFEAEPA